MTTVYLDTSIWLSFGFSKDKNHLKALDIIKKIRSGAYVALISRHVLSEVLDVLKDRAVTHPTVKTSQDPKIHRNLAEAWFKGFMTKILGLPNVRIRDPTTPLVQILKDRQQVLTQVWGNFSTSNKCPICHSAFNFLEYHCPARDDALHVIIADENHCDLLLAFDEDFAILGKLARFAHMPIQVV